MPAGWDNNCEEWVDLTPEERIWSDADRVLRTRAEVLHAESNAISKMARSSESAEGADLFITHSPCMECAKLIYQSGIRRVYYDTDYRSDQGVKFLKQSGVEVVKHGD
jgi:dCMP deaminase